jgi:hypothetical protein
MKLNKPVLFSVLWLVLALFPTLYATSVGGSASVSATIDEARRIIQKALVVIYGADKPISFVAAQAKAGDAASGVVIRKTSDSLVLDITPCTIEKKIVTFVNPYKDSSVSDIRCPDNKAYERVQVIQQ